MSGHSKWATIKRKKGATDAKKGAVFTKLVKNITIAARNGKDPDMNPALRSAMDQAKVANMPKDNVEKAILKGAGELPGVVYEEVVFEAYGPGGIAMIIECVTDNNNRTVSFVRSSLTKHGGSLGGSGSVMYMFEQKGVIRIAAEDIPNQDELELAVIDAGAEDIQVEEEGVTIITGRADLNTIVQMLEKMNITPASFGVEYITNTMLDPDESASSTLSSLIEVLEDNEDVNSVHTNANL